MHDYSRWSLNWGWWGGVRVRLHASFVVVLVLAVYLGSAIYLESGVPAPADASLYGLMGAAILLMSVILHELGHLIVARWLGGSTDLVVLGPLGGMNPPHVPREPQRELTAALAGPVANLAVLVVSGIGLLIAGINPGDFLLQPLYPDGLLHGAAWLVALKMVFWLNWILLAVNTIPAAPLDGGRALRSVLWPVMGYRGAVRVVSHCGMLTALGLCLTAWLVHGPDDYRLAPSWLPLVILAVYLYFSARIEGQRVEEDDEEDQLFGYDFSQGYTSLDVVPPRRERSRLRRWIDKRREAKQRRLRQLEVDEEHRVDEVLIRVKEAGIEALSPEERALLQRVSARYRSRLQS